MPQAVSLAQLTTQLAQGMVAPVYLLIGEEDLLRDAALSQLKQSLLGDGGDDFNCDVFYGDEAEGAQIISCASEIAVFASRRLVIVKVADKLPARQCDALLPYLKAPNELSTLVFVASKLDGRLKFTQALMQASVAVDCAPLKDSQLVPWLKQEADRVGVRSQPANLSHNFGQAAGHGRAAHQENRAVGQQCGGVTVSACSQAASRTPAVGGRVIQLGAR